MITEKVDQILKETCLEIAQRYDMHFLEVGTDKDHVHFLVQSVPIISPSKLAQTVKSITAKQVFQPAPEVKKHLWGGQFWSDGYFISTVGKQGSESKITTYVRQQGKTKEYIRLHKDQLTLF